MSNVKSYTDIQLLDKVKTLKGFKGIPETYWILAVRSNEDETDSTPNPPYVLNIFTASTIF